MLTLTDSAVSAIRDLLADTDVTEAGGLRISAAPPSNGDDHPTFELAVVTGPELTDSVIERVVCTNTLPLGPDKQIDKIEQLSVAPIIGRAIDAVFRDESVSEIFDGNNLS